MESFLYYLFLVICTNNLLINDKGGDLQSFIPGLFGLLCLAYNYIVVKKVSDGIHTNSSPRVTSAALLSDNTYSMRQSQDNQFGL